MLLPCRFCTRMSLICPINSSRSNQSSHSCPAIWSRAECCRGPGQDYSQSSRLEEEKLLRRTRSIVRPCKPGAQAETAGGSVTGRTALLFTAGFLSSQRSGGSFAVRTAVQMRGEQRRKRLQQATWLVFPRWDGADPVPAHLSLSFCDIIPTSNFRLPR